MERGCKLYLESGTVWEGKMDRKTVVQRKQLHIDWDFRQAAGM